MTTKRPPNDWIRSLQIFNTGNKVYIVPKKGSEEYNKVIEIMNELKKEKTVKTEDIVIIEEVKPSELTNEEIKTLESPVIDEKLDVKSWIKHVKEVQKEKGISYKEALKIASQTYKK